MPLRERRAEEPVKREPRKVPEIGNTVRLRGRAPIGPAGEKAPLSWNGIDEHSLIWQAIDWGGGQTCDVVGVLRALDTAGFKIVPKGE